MKKKKIIYIPNAKLIFRDLNYIKFFDNIKIKNYIFLFTNKKNIPKGISKSNYKVISKVNKYRYNIWEIVHFLNRFNYEKKNFKIKPTQNLELNLIKFLFFIFVIFFKLDKLLIYLLNKIFNFSKPKDYNFIKNFNEVIFLVLQKI